jgi:transcriptional regulator with XRE-family HTH domain
VVCITNIATIFGNCKNLTTKNKKYLQSLQQRMLAVRKKAGLSQEVFAQKVGTSRSIISQIEIGKIKPTYDVLIATANEFGVDYKYLLEGEFAETSPKNMVAEPQATYKNEPIKDLQKEIWFLQKENALLTSQVARLEELLAAYKKMLPDSNT